MFIFYAAANKVRARSFCVHIYGFHCILQWKSLAKKRLRDDGTFAIDLGLRFGVRMWPKNKTDHFEINPKNPGIQPNYRFMVCLTLTTWSLIMNRLPDEKVTPLLFKVFSEL